MLDALGVTWVEHDQLANLEFATTDQARMTNTVTDEGRSTLVRSLHRRIWSIRSGNRTVERIIMPIRATTEALSALKSVPRPYISS